MIELIAAAGIGAAFSGAVLSLTMGQKIDELRERISGEVKAGLAIYAKLTALRSNCFITNEKGHRVRYSQASAQRRVKAETPKEVV